MVPRDPTPAQRTFPVTTWGAHAPVGEDLGGLPAGHEGGEQPQHQCRAVKQHVEAVGDQAQAVGPHAVKQLHESECLEDITIII